MTDQHRRRRRARERRTEHNEARDDVLLEHGQRVAATDDPIEALAQAIAGHELTQLAHLPIGGGYGIIGRARKLATFVVDLLAEHGWVIVRTTRK